MKNIRKITLSDIEKCAELYVNVFNSEPWNDHWTIESAYNRLKDIFDSPHFIGLIYEEEALLKGAIYGNCEHWYEGMHYNLREMFVSNDKQGQGIGRGMFEELEKLVLDKNVGTTILFTSKGNKTNEFYKKNGFEDYEEMVMMGKDYK